MGEKLYYGAAYYPELWDDKVIEEDIIEMKKVGINFVRMGEFAWVRMEPELNKFDMSLFLKVITKLNDNGIETIFCTPTPTPPIWLTHPHPETLFVKKDGTKMSHGSRQHCCINNEYFRERTAIIVEEVSKTFGDYKGVIGWQIDNELKCHVAECYCEECKNQWHEWLGNKYKTIEELNEAWGTEIWSEKYFEFNQVPQPKPTPTQHNPSLKTAYQLFSMEKTAEFVDSQAEIIRKYSKLPITHNSNRYFDTDIEKMFSNLDFAAFDDYPNYDQYQEMLMNYDLYRNAKNGKCFWVMETGTIYGISIASSKKPHKDGFVTAEMVAAYASGAEGFSYWLWRQQRTGIEMSHGSVISSWGKPTLGYKNVVDANHARNQIQDLIVNSHPCKAEVALLYSDRARTFLNSENFAVMDYRKQMMRVYEIILNTGIHRDIIFEGSELTGYKLILTPFIPYISDELREKMLNWVKSGGTWIVGPLSGYRTGEHTVHIDCALGELEKLAGIETVFHYNMIDSEIKGNAFGCIAELSYFGCVFDLKDAKAMGVTEGGNTPDMPFITEKKLGKGKIVMLGATPVGEQGDVLFNKIIEYYSDAAEVQLKFNVTPGTIVYPRKNGEKTLWVIVNMDGNGGKVKIQGPAVDALTNKELSGEIQISSYEYRIIYLKFTKALSE